MLKEEIEKTLKKHMHEYEHKEGGWSTYLDVTQATIDLLELFKKYEENHR